MLRDDDHGRTSFAGGGTPDASHHGPVRRSAARGAPWVLRLIAAPFAAVAAAIAGIVFVVLLPICGIATICEGIVRTSWRFVREAFDHVPHPPARRI